MPAIKMHMSLAQSRKSLSVYPVSSCKADVHYASYPIMILPERYTALAAISEGLYLSMRCSIKGNSIRYLA